MVGKLSLSSKVLTAGFGLATLVMVGCQQTEPTLSTESEATTVEALRLGIKNSDSCKSELKGLRDAFVAAKGDSALLADLIAKHASFVGACVEKSEPVTKDGPPHLSRPPLLTPDSAACAWKVDAIGDQDTAVEVRYRHVCSDKGPGRLGGGFGKPDSSVVPKEKPVRDTNWVRPEKPANDSASHEGPDGDDHLGAGFGGDKVNCDSNHVITLPKAPRDSAEVD
jgi:hypothetical protein